MFGKNLNKNLNTIINGDALQKLRQLPDESVDCIVTSPPYWGLKDYGVKGQIGLEPTYEAYIENLMLIIAECKRVLKSTGTFFLNIGDSYSGSGNGQNSPNQSSLSYNTGKRTEMKSPVNRSKKIKNIPFKSMLLIPEKVAIKMQEKGWILRNKIIWHKPNCMPESVKDRFTNDFEPIFFFVKQGRYKFIQIKTPLKKESVERMRKSWNGKIERGGTGKNQDFASMFNKSEKEIVAAKRKGANLRCVWEIPTASYKGSHFAVFPNELAARCIKSGSPKNGIVLDPFAGSGTVLEEAKKLGRNYIGIELNKNYIKLIKERLAY